MRPIPTGSGATDFLLRLVGNLFPVPWAAGVTSDQYQALHARHRQADGAAQAASLLGFLTGGVMPIVTRPPPMQYSPWDIGVMFGAGVGFPLAVIYLTAAVRGGKWLDSFWTYYSVRYGSNAWQVARWVYLPLAAVGLVSAVFAYT